MTSWLLLVLRSLTGLARSHASLATENALLRYQLAVLQRERPGPLLRPADRVLWTWLARHWNRWRQALVLIQPATVLRWHREGYRRYWRQRSGGAVGRPSPQAQPYRRRRPETTTLCRIVQEHLESYGLLPKT